MNRKYSELNKQMQQELKKRETFDEGIKSLFLLRSKLFEEILSFKTNLSRDDFDALPYINAAGYHKKNIAYSLYHVFRIEDIVCNTLIKDEEQVFFSKNYLEKMKSPIITTGNELEKEEIANFTKQLDLDELYNYITDVKNKSEKVLKELCYDDMKQKISAENKEKLKKLNVVSENENAFWLIDYWTSKDVKSLVQMPFSRHWIMHIEACFRIRDKINRLL